VLVLNAGCVSGGRFVEQTDDEIEMMVQINANHVIYTAKAMVKQLVDRFNTKK